MDIEPNKENIVEDSSDKTVFSYHDEFSKPVYTTKVIFKKSAKIIGYPYSYSKLNGIAKKKISEIEFIGWESLDILPAYFRNKNNRIGLHGKVIKAFMRPIYSNYKGVTKLIIDKNDTTRFGKKSIRLGWPTLNNILTKIKKVQNFSERNAKVEIYKHLNNLKAGFSTYNTALKKKDIAYFLSLFTDTSNLAVEDIDSLSEVLGKVPGGSIKITKNFIKTRDKINHAYLEDIISRFKKLRTSKKKNEKDWQSFIEENGWILNYLFPYDVILFKKEAFVGGKTIENSEGRFVDFLYQNGFQDNYSLVEIKTHNTSLLKDTPYRKPAAYSMTDDFSGAISQCIDQKNTFISELGQKYNINDPKVVLIIGDKSTLSDSQSKCFELIRSNQKYIDITTFDELQKKMEGLEKILKN